MDHPAVTLAAFILPLIALRDVGFAYYHLYQRLDPEPRQRAARAVLQYLTVLVWFFSIYAVVQLAIAVLLGEPSPITAAIIGTVATIAINRYVLKKPTDWQGRAPYLARDRRYDAFLKVLADRAAEVRGKPEHRDRYLERFHADDRTRLQVISAYLEEYPERRMIGLRPDQLAYHPSYNRLSRFLIYLLALTPMIVPFAIGIINPTVTDENADLTTIAAILGTLLYGPLFDEGAAWTWFLLSAALVIGTAVMMEFDRTRAIAPGFASFAIFAMLLFVIWHYLDAYVVRELDTPLIRATDYLLRRLDAIEDHTESRFARFIIDMAGGGEQLRSFKTASAVFREQVAQFQRIAGGLFILPAVLFWGWISSRAIWELQFSEAAEVTFHLRMRMPEI